jgi:hypothetical protein
MEVAIVSFLLPPPTGPRARIIYKPALTLHGIIKVHSAESIPFFIESEAEKWVGAGIASTVPIKVHKDFIPTVDQKPGTFALVQTDDSQHYTLWYVGEQVNRGWVYNTTNIVLHNLGYFMMIAAQYCDTDMSFHDMKKTLDDMKDKMVVLQSLDRQVMRAWYEERNQSRENQLSKHGFAASICGEGASTHAI